MISDVLNLWDTKELLDDVKNSLANITKAKKFNFILVSHHIASALNNNCNSIFLLPFQDILLFSAMWGRDWTVVTSASLDPPVTFHMEKVHKYLWGLFGCLCLLTNVVVQM